MCKEESTRDEKLPVYCFDEIRKHNTKTDRWLVIDGCVYDVTNWAKKHPGGERIIANHAGEDATDAWVAFHNDKAKVSKYLRPLLKGYLRKEECRVDELTQDFRELRQTVEQMGLFRASPFFFITTLGQCLVMEAGAIAVLWWWGTGWLPFMLATLLCLAAQAQAGWSQHDFGHLSVFNSSAWNHRLHIFIINFLKGVSSSWWNYRHYLHHAKPNIIRKDPDIRLDYLFLIGETLPVEWGKKKKGFMPYNFQHNYFYMILPPLLLPLYFNFEVPYFLLTRKLYGEMFWMVTFFVRYILMFAPFFGVGGALLFYLWVRFLESHWFVWTTQMSHIPMEVDYDHGRDWVTMQLRATCNVEQSFFNDWFSGHLNFQIEHHLFPTMPRHNLHKATPLVRSLCEKHGLNYQCKSLFTAMKDIVGSLKASGKMWYEAYHM